MACAPPTLMPRPTDIATTQTQCFKFILIVFTLLILRLARIPFCSGRLKLQAETEPWRAGRSTPMTVHARRAELRLPEAERSVWRRTEASTSNHIWSCDLLWSVAPSPGDTGAMSQRLRGQLRGPVASCRAIRRPRAAALTSIQRSRRQIERAGWLIAILNVRHQGAGFCAPVFEMVLPCCSGFCLFFSLAGADVFVDMWTGPRAAWTFAIRMMR